MKMPNPSQESPVPTKARNQDIKDMDVPCTFKIKIESQNLRLGCIKAKKLYQNHDQDAKLQSGTFSMIQSTKNEIKGVDVICPYKTRTGDIPLFV